MSEPTQGLELPNNMKPKDYPQKFVQSKEFPKAPPKGKK